MHEILANALFMFIFLFAIGPVIFTILAVIYYLKVKYAEEYGLDKYLPKKPKSYRDRWY